MKESKDDSRFCRKITLSAIAVDPKKHFNATEHRIVLTLQINFILDITIFYFDIEIIDKETQNAHES